MTPSEQSIRLRKYLRRQKMLITDIGWWLARGRNTVIRPVFVVGCGRSGTTILGRILAQHSGVVYLHEPHDIWRVEPKTDIWSQNVSEHGQLRLDRHDVTLSARARITRAFDRRLAAHPQTNAQLVEKLPINAFRIDYIDHLFPQARFIHLLRNGIEVARSIEKRIEVGVWYGGYGAKGHKWKLLADDATQQGLNRLVQLSEPDYFLRGLLEWRLSVTSCLDAQHLMPPDRWLEVRYETLLDDPFAMCQRMEQFIGLDPSPIMHQFAVDTVQRQTPKTQTIPSQAWEIAGDLLKDTGYISE